MYSISKFAELTGLTADTLRYYEKEGLLRPERNDSGYRDYSEEDLRWVEFLQRLRGADMPIRQMARYCELRTQGDSTMGERLALLRLHEKELARDLQKREEHLRVLREKIQWYEKKLDRQQGRA